MTTDRYPMTAPVFRLFRELAHLPPAERTEALMIRLEHVWEQAQSRSYTNKHGDEIASPDGTLQLKVIQAVAVLQGLTGPAAEGEAKRLADMSDAELLREATKRLPPAELAALADQLIAMREQQLTKPTILATGETNDEQRSEEARSEEAAEADPDRPDPEEPDPGPRRAKRRRSGIVP